ncbi:uncharacterized protein G2W53_033317 [Senna tora]|uniref:Uncharacterized protein n=1 Tax=Senna tora TaxID=362788 RepID=A0A834T0Y1_9FABA|nr:uncharacterized protein G2W53_033317 [Senna tora]
MADHRINTCLLLGACIVSAEDAYYRIISVSSYHLIGFIDNQFVLQYQFPLHVDYYGRNDIMLLNFDSTRSWSTLKAIRKDPYQEIYASNIIKTSIFNASYQTNQPEVCATRHNKCYSGATKCFPTAFTHLS